MTTNNRADQVLAALRGEAVKMNPVSLVQHEVHKQRSDAVRFTFDVARDQHRFIRQFVLDSDTNASAATRTLWTLVQDDSGLAERLRGLLTGHGQEVQ
jgi:hypothetical protein